VVFGKSWDEQQLNFKNIPTDYVNKATFYCDITAAGVTFDKLAVSYTVVPKDAGDTDTYPDDDAPMTAWGVQPPGHKGYFSVGTPKTILHAGGTQGNFRPGPTSGIPKTFTFSTGSTDRTWTVRLGFSQSERFEDFSIKDLVITIGGIQPACHGEWFRNRRRWDGSRNCPSGMFPEGNRRRDRYDGTPGCCELACSSSTSLSTCPSHCAWVGSSCESPTESPTSSPTETPTSSPTSSPTKTPMSFPTSSPTGPPTHGDGSCLPWCEHKNSQMGWDSKCGFDACNGCNACSDRAGAHKEGGYTNTDGCEPWCEDDSRPWSTKCGFQKACDSCNACS